MAESQTMPNVRDLVINYHLIVMSVVRRATVKFHQCYTLKSKNIALLWNVTAVRCPGSGWCLHNDKQSLSVKVSYFIVATAKLLVNSLKEFSLRSRRLQNITEVYYSLLRGFAV